MAFAFGDSIKSDFATSIDSSMNFLSRILPPPMKIAGFERKSTCNSRSWSRISFACSSVTQRIVFFYIIRQNCFLFAEDCVYMLILYTHIVQSTNFPYNFVVHSYNTCFKAAAELHIRFPVPQEQYIGCISANVYNKHSESVYKYMALWYHCLKSLWKDQNLIHNNYCMAYPYN